MIPDSEGKLIVIANLQWTYYSTYCAFLFGNDITDIYSISSV